MAFEDDENMRDLLRRVTESMQSGLQATSGDGLVSGAGFRGMPSSEDSVTATKAPPIRSKPVHDPSTNPALKPHTEFIGAPTNPDIETQPMLGGEVTDRGDAARKVSQALLLASPEGPVGGSGSKIPGPLGGANLPSGRLGDSEGGEGRSGMKDYSSMTPSPNIRPAELGKPEPGEPTAEDLYYTQHSESQHHGVKNRLKHGLESALLLADPGDNGWKYGLGQLTGNMLAGIISPKNVDKAYDERIAKPRQQREKAEADRETVRQYELRKIGQEEEIRKGQIERGKQPNWIQFPDPKTGHYGLYDPGSGQTKDTPIGLPPPVAAPRKTVGTPATGVYDITDPNAAPRLIIPGKPEKPDKPPSASEAKTIAEQAEAAGIDYGKLHADYAGGRKNRLQDILGGADVFKQINDDLRSGDEQTKADAARRMAAAQKQFNDEIDADIEKEIKKHVGQRTMDILGPKGQAQPLPAPQGTQTPGAVAPAHSSPAQVRAGARGPDPNTHAAMIVNELRRQGKTDAEIQAELRKRGLAQ